MFDRKKYRKEYYLKNRDKILEKDKIKYDKNKELIRKKRKEYISKESSDKRAKRLSFHRKYNYENRQIQKTRIQTDKYKFKMYKSSAQKRGYAFDLEQDKFTKLFHLNCWYCWKKDARGLDRVNNLIGYTEENTVPCCEMCNKMKWKWGYSEFISQIDKIYKNLNQKL